MEVIKYETCIEHFRRLLREGWKCTYLEGHNAVLFSPDGLRRKLDLRNDVVTLRPNAPGDSTQLKPVNTATNWQNVDEAALDNSDYNYNQESASWLADLYNLPDPGLSGTINSVTLYYTGCAPDDSLWAGMLKTNGVSHTTDTKTNDNWVSYNTVYANNPETLVAWTCGEIDALQIGAFCKSYNADGWMEAKLSQVYVIVDYTPAPPGWSGKISGVTNPAEVMGVAKASIEEVKGVASA